MKAPLSPADTALIRFAKVLTERPASVTEEDLDALRREGFDDRAIHDIVQVVALFAYYNRMAEGLGVRLVDDPS